jgi:hypothetical protein
LGACTDDFDRVPSMLSARYPVFENLLSSADDGKLTKAIGWGTWLACNPLGLNFSNMDQRSPDPEARRVFWETFFEETGHQLDGMRKAIKTVKDVGAVNIHAFNYLRDAKDKDYSVGYLEKYLLNPDVINELNE